MSSSKRDQPRTGDGRRGGDKPKPADLSIRTPQGYPTQQQPRGWSLGRLLPFRRRRG